MNINLFIEKKYKVIVCGFFILYFVLGLMVFDDYGISWDEPKQRISGITTFNYVIKGNDALFSYNDRYYGVVFESVLIWLEVLSGLGKNLRAVFFMRHCVNFILFFIGIIFFYLLCRAWFSSWKIGLLGCLFLILSPRIFAHSFYNSKDIPFLVFFIISIYTLLKYLDKKHFAWIVLHSIICALLIDTRIIGIIVPFLTIVFLIMDTVFKKISIDSVKNMLFKGLLFSILLIGFIIVFWPLLWRNPFENFINAVLHMSKFPWKWTLLYLGKYIPAKNLPWHYVPVWIMITVPLWCILWFCVGLSNILYNCLKNFREFYFKYKLDLICIMWILLPLMFIIIKKPLLLDGWRHTFFIYPAISIIGLRGIYSLAVFLRSKLNIRVYLLGYVFLICFVILSLLNTAYTMVRIHPYQNVYFNVLAGPNENITENFELDYWGLSYRSALEYILANDKRDKINIYAENFGVIVNSIMIPADELKRIKFVDDLSGADYLVTNFRWNQHRKYLYKEYYSVEVNGLKIAAVYRTSPDS